MKKQQTTLRLIRVVLRETKHSPTQDMRRKLNYVVVSYLGTDGHEYRKSFESYSDPEIPDMGTHPEINAKSKQW